MKTKIGFDYIHAMVDDHSRLAYAEILPDEQGTTSAGVLLRAAVWFAGHGIAIRQMMTDNAWNYRRSAAFADAVAAIGARQLFIQPHCPWQNGKVERLNRTLATEWAYRQPWTSNTQRADALDGWLDYYSNERYHHSIHPSAVCHERDGRVHLGCLPAERMLGWHHIGGGPPSW